MILTEAQANRLLSTGDYGQADPPAAGYKTYWDAYSDRSDNTTYDAPNSSVPYAKLSFNEKVRIAKISGDWALVYTEPKVEVAYPNISENATCRGWVKMDKLLLWQNCLANERGIYNKALLCLNLENGGDLTKAVGYKNPNQKGESLNLSTDLDFYFIMKKEGDMALLAIQNRMDGAISSEVLYCWVKDSYYVAWNQRSCLEPTWEHEDVHYFASNEIKVRVYPNRDLKGNDFTEIPFFTKENDMRNQYIYRMDKDLLRYPILDNGTQIIYNMSTFGTMGGNAQGTDKDTPKTAAQMINENKESALKTKTNINLAIVIDGTSSMAPYYPAVKEAIKEGCQYFTQDYKIRIGVVIFRDYADGEKGLVEICPLTDVKNIQRINDFLDTGGEYGIKSSPKDLTSEEALYYGINTALDKLRFRDGESNIMLVVGDCGNDVNDIQCTNQDSLIYKIVEKDIHLMGFQVQNKSTAAYNNFNTQLNEIMRGSLKDKYQKLDEGSKIRGIPSVDENGFRDGYNFKGVYKDTTNNDGQFWICNHRYAPTDVNNGKMNPEKLSSLMVTSISDFAKTVQKQLDAITSMRNADLIELMRGTDKQLGIDMSTAKFVRDQLIASGLDPDKLPNDVVLNFKGWAPKKDGDRNFFKPVIFISDEEFQELIKRLRPVSEAASISQVKDRTPYIEAMKALVKSLAPGMTDAEMAKLSNKQIMNMIAGLNEAAPSLSSRYTLDDMSDPNVVSAGEYSRIITDFQDKFNNLEYIRNNTRYEFLKEFNSAKYYWIPIEDLP